MGNIPVPDFSEVWDLISNMLSSNIIISILAALAAIYIGERVVMGTVNIFMHIIERATSHPSAADTHMDHEGGIE